MQIVNTVKLLIELKKIEPEGYEVCTKLGLLSTTKALYFHKGLFYVFLMEYDFCFDRENGLSEYNFTKEYKNWMWKIEQIIS